MSGLRESSHKLFELKQNIIGKKHFYCSYCKIICNVRIHDSLTITLTFCEIILISNVFFQGTLPFIQHY